MSDLSITFYTDPMCTWCYAQDAMLRNLQFNTDDAIDVHFVLGLMVPDVASITGDAEGDEAETRVEDYRNEQAKAVEEAMKNLALPFDADHFARRSADQLVSRPAALATEAMKLIDEKQAILYLRRLREAFHAEGRDVTDLATLEELAAGFPVDQEAFRCNLEDGSAEQALEEDLATCQERGVLSFPQMELGYGTDLMRLKGFLPYRQILVAIQEITGKTPLIPPRPSTFENHVAFVRRFGRVAAVEMQMAFYLSSKRLHEAVQGLLDCGGFAVEEAGNSYFIVER